MTDIAKLSREQLLTPAMKTGVERLVVRIVSGKQGKKAYLLAELLREKLGDLAKPQSPEERAYLHMLMEIDVVSIPLHPEDEVIALLHEVLPILLDQSVDVGERLQVKLVDLPEERREAFRKRLLDLFGTLGQSPALERLKQQIAGWRPSEGFFVRHNDGSWERVGAPPPAEVPPLQTAVEVKPLHSAPAPLPAVRLIPPPPAVSLQQKQPPRVVKQFSAEVPPLQKKVEVEPLRSMVDQPKPQPPRQPATRRPQMHDIKPPQPLTSPFDQLRTIDPNRLTSHSSGPDEFFQDVEAQIRSFQKGGVTEYAKAVAAWRESPLFDLYRSIARESLVSKTPLAAVIADRIQRGDAALEESAVESIRALNERLRLA